ncbi:MAG: cupin domain-containing protein [Ardenticatenaceae bacterium]|nr:cupin domain-containing protein [Ardenticatenaceae bacterium]
MYYFDPIERQSKELAPGVLARTFWGDKMLMSVVEFLPGATVPDHSHAHEQVGIVLEGELTMTIGDQTKVLRPGDVYVIPGDVEHNAKAEGGPAKVLDIFSPVRDEYKY